ncbi:hypothetical protein LIER_15053 [Lithospermum erythrorhizon]|uniref:Retrotransposon gag domain-containing protein n=1 Tax=Lithospermum erythrorhizon TaxID=34254 RepID=A0AAV3Q3X0_LITER
MPVGIEVPVFTKFTGKKDPKEHITEFQSQMSFHQPDSRVYYNAFPSSLADLTLKWFKRLPEGCITSLEELKNRFTRTYVGRVRQEKDENFLTTIKQRKTESIASFQEGLDRVRFDTWGQSKDCYNCLCGGPAAEQVQGLASKEAAPGSRRGQ